MEYLRTLSRVDPIPTLDRDFLGLCNLRSTLATETGANNPGLRLYKYDTDSGQVFTVML